MFLFINTLILRNTLVIKKIIIKKKDLKINFFGNRILKLLVKVLLTNILKICWNHYLKIKKFLNLLFQFTKNYKKTITYKLNLIYVLLTSKRVFSTNILLLYNIYYLSFLSIISIISFFKSTIVDRYYYFITNFIFIIN